MSGTLVWKPNCSQASPTEYTVIVHAIDNDPSVQLSDLLTYKIKVNLPPVSNVVATPVAGSMNVTWDIYDPSLNCQDFTYNIYRSLDSVFSYGIYMFAMEGIIFNLAYMLFFKDKKIPLKFILSEKYKILFASLLVTFAYLPILYAFTKVNVPSVAALREISILFTSIYGVYFLKEKFGLIKVISAALVVIGCITIRIAAG